MLQMSLIVESKRLSWYLDNGCSQQMTRERCIFQCLTPNHGGIVTFEGNQEIRITRVGKIGIHPYLSIDNFLFVLGLVNLLNTLGFMST